MKLMGLLWLASSSMLLLLIPQKAKADHCSSIDITCPPSHRKGGIIKIDDPPDSMGSNCLSLSCEGASTFPPIAEGIFKFEGRPAIYYSNGKGAYCVYDTWDNYVRLTGNPGWRTQSGKLSNYSARYDGVCAAGGSRPAPHPDPNF